MCLQPSKSELNFAMFKYQSDTLQILSKLSIGFDFQINPGTEF